MKKCILIIILSAGFINRGNCNVDSQAVSQKSETLEMPSDLQKEHYIELENVVRDLRSDLEKLKEDEDKFDYLSLIPWGFAIITIVLSVLVYRREVSFRNIAFVTESNKMKIADPALWSFYDNHKKEYESRITVEKDSALQIDGSEKFEIKQDGSLKITGTAEPVGIKINGNPVRFVSDEPIMVTARDQVKIDGKASIEASMPIVIKGAESKALEGKIRAFCYYKLNSFELVFNYNRKTCSSNKEWENYMIDSLIYSIDFYNIAKKESEQYLYSEKYRQKLREFLIVAGYCKRDEVAIGKIILSKKAILKKIRSKDLNEGSLLSEIGKCFNKKA